MNKVVQQYDRAIISGVYLHDCVIGTTDGAEYDMRILERFADKHPTPWANGAGLSTDLVTPARAVELSGPGVRPWRVSIAQLERPAEFSLMPRVDRRLLVVGGLVDLDIDGRALSVPSGTSIDFPGEATVRLTALSAPCSAVNLMSTRTPGRGVTMTGGKPSAEAFAGIALDSSGSYDRFDLLSPTPLSAAGAIAWLSVTS